MSGPPDDFVSGFLDDYFAEAEEHLGVIRRALLGLEHGMDDPAGEANYLEELFRSFHSLKGISAMVDLRDAERLAHEHESYLRALREGDAALTAEALSVLMDGTATLERVIAARRAQAEAPPIDATIARLAALMAVPRAQSAGTPGGPGGAASEPSAWRIVFTPSPLLVERGVKVDTVRARLASVGRITSVSPRVLSGGGIAFEFIVAGPADAAVFEGWQHDGLAWERLDADQAVETSPTGQTAAAVPIASAESILAPAHFVRVDLKRLDDVMRRVADLVATRARFEENLARVEHALPANDWRTLQENALLLERQLRDLREDVMRVRLVRVDEIFRRMPFVARDVAREAGKDVRLLLSGQDTEIDKFLVERMMDPVLHLVRNAISHGIETPQARLAAGKPRQGVVALTASTSGEMVLLEIADDGAGIDVEAVAERARMTGIPVAGPLDARALVEVICEPGFSTRREADRASGRGMGMSVVRTTVQELGGTLRVDTGPGRGTRFIMSLPLTLAITDALIAEANGQRFAVPQNAVQEVLEIDSASIREIERHELVPYRGRSLPLLRLRDLFGFPRAAPGRFHAFVIGGGPDAVALGVDRILGQREIVVRTITDRLLKVDGISGATELGDGRVVLILDALALARADAGRRRFVDRAGGRAAGSAAGSTP